MIAILDYGVGNVFSLQCSLRYIGAESMLTADPEIIGRADRLILPGVGAFGDAAALLRESGLDLLLLAEVRAGKPLLGVCLGMQLLYEGSCEYGEHSGLGLIPGRIRSLAADLGDPSLKVPHMGWNTLQKRRDCPLLQGTREGEAVYFVHSFYAPVTEDAAACARYGDLQMTAVAQRGGVFGTQFHPEKSGDVGLEILRAFAAC